VRTLDNLEKQLLAFISSHKGRGAVDIWLQGTVEGHNPRKQIAVLRTRLANHGYQHSSNPEGDAPGFVGQSVPVDESVVTPTNRDYFLDQGPSARTTRILFESGSVALQRVVTVCGGAAFVQSAAAMTHRTLEKEGQRHHLVILNGPLDPSVLVRSILTRAAPSLLSDESRPATVSAQIHRESEKGPSARTKERSSGEADQEAFAKTPIATDGALASKPPEPSSEIHVLLADDLCVDDNGQLERRRKCGVAWDTGLDGGAMRSSQEAAFVIADSFATMLGVTGRDFDWHSVARFGAPVVSEPWPRHHTDRALIALTLGRGEFARGVLGGIVLRLYYRDWRSSDKTLLKLSPTGKVFTLNSASNAVVPFSRESSSPVSLVVDAFRFCAGETTNCQEVAAKFPALRTQSTNAVDPDPWAITVPANNAAIVFHIADRFGEDCNVALFQLGQVVARGTGNDEVACCQAATMPTAAEVVSLSRRLRGSHWLNNPYCDVLTQYQDTGGGYGSINTWVGLFQFIADGDHGLKVSLQLRDPVSDEERDDAIESAPENVAGGIVNRVFMVTAVSFGDCQKDGFVWPCDVPPRTLVCCPYIRMRRQRACTVRDDGEAWFKDVGDDYPAALTAESFADTTRIVSTWSTKLISSLCRATLPLGAVASIDNAATELYDRSAEYACERDLVEPCASAPLRSIPEGVRESISSALKNEDEDERSKFLDLVAYLIEIEIGDGNGGVLAVSRGVLRVVGRLLLNYGVAADFLQQDFADSNGGYSSASALLVRFVTSGEFDHLWRFFLHPTMNVACVTRHMHGVSRTSETRKRVAHAVFAVINIHMAVTPSSMLEGGSVSRRLGSDPLRAVVGIGNALQSYAKGLDLVDSLFGNWERSDWVTATKYALVVGATSFGCCVYLASHPSKAASAVRALSSQGTLSWLYRLDSARRVLTAAVVSAGIYARAVDESFMTKDDMVNHALQYQGVKESFGHLTKESVDAGLVQPASSWTQGRSSIFELIDRLPWRFGYVDFILNRVGLGGGDVASLLRNISPTIVNPLHVLALGQAGKMYATSKNRLAVMQARNVINLAANTSEGLAVIEALTINQQRAGVEDGSIGDSQMQKRLHEIHSEHCQVPTWLTCLTMPVKFTAVAIRHLWTEQSQLMSPNFARDAVSFAIQYDCPDPIAFDGLPRFMLACVEFVRALFPENAENGTFLGNVWDGFWESRVVRGALTLSHFSSSRQRSLSPYGCLSSGKLVLDAERGSIIDGELYSRGVTDSAGVFHMSFGNQRLISSRSLFRLGRSRPGH
jgi:hypothetical protein